jgi:hypothetical protein
MLVLFTAGYKKYKAGMAPNGIFIPNFMTISQLVQQLKETLTTLSSHTLNAFP